MASFDFLIISENPINGLDSSLSILTIENIDECSQTTPFSAAVLLSSESKNQLNEIRKKSFFQNTPIAISLKTLSLENYNNYRFKGILILPQPFNTDHINYFFQYFTKTQLTAPANEVLFAAQKNYINSIGEKLEKLNNDIVNGDLNQLLKDVHKIAGSAGLYGFMEVSQICKNWQSWLEGIIKNPTLYNKEKSNQFFEHILFYFQFPSPINL
ncbi:MAG: Hpt domain-containing protein [Parachlamydiales bacterium]|nr:Hpt domain-containing protein [Parachlamydiales bacterium]